MQTPISVSELNNQIKSLLESTFISVYVEGEVSRVTYHSSGHLYFTLKDKNSSISCVMFRGNNQRLKFRVEEGLKVIIQGAISVYTPRGSYQINCVSMEPSGSGALALAYEQLKKKLEAKGYFKPNLKKSIPKYPKTIALITSKTGAALQDMLRVAKKRWPLVKIILINTLVQGDEAKYSIVRALKKADNLKVDIIVLSRGGGSLEDLWAFNEEIVADAIHEAKTPVVSAVGHEIDFMISDFVADLRAPTPSAAMEMILPDMNEMLIYLDNLEDNFHSITKRVLLKKSEELRNLYYAYKQNSIMQKLTLFQNEITSLKLRYDETFAFQLEKKEQYLSTLYQYITEKQKQNINKKEQHLTVILQAIEANNPEKRVKESFAQIVKDKKPISIDLLKPDDIFELVSTKAKVKAKSISVINLHQ
jgi:exodeoxyribonuclease VII large subunit